MFYFCKLTPYSTSSYKIASRRSCIVTIVKDIWIIKSEWFGFHPTAIFPSEKVAMCVTVTHLWSLLLSAVALFISVTCQQAQSVCLSPRDFKAGVFIADMHVDLSHYKRKERKTGLTFRLEEQEVSRSLQSQPINGKCPAANKRTWWQGHDSNREMLLFCLYI